MYPCDKVFIFSSTLDVFVFTADDNVACSKWRAQPLNSGSVVKMAVGLHLSALEGGVSAKA